MEDFPRWLGARLGEAIRWVVETLTGAFSGVDAFIEGLTGALGMSDSVAAVALLVLGLVLLYAAARRLARAKWISGLLSLALSLLLLGWLIN